MAEGQFQALREALLRAGIAPRHVCRAVGEISDHYEVLVAAAIAGGAEDHEARLAARDLLGSDSALVSRYADQPELHAWPSRFPAAWFTLLPMLGFLAALAAAFAAIVLLGDHWSAALHRIQLRREVTLRIDLAVRILLLWVLPLLLAAGFAMQAWRRRIAPAWPGAGVLLLSALAAVLNVGLKITGGAVPGEASAGMGISADTWPGQAAHALVIAAAVVGPLWLAARRARRSAIPSG